MSELEDPTDLSAADAERWPRMKKSNPKYILRNHLAQQVIEQAERGDFEGVIAYFGVLQRPFEEGTEEEEKRWAGSVPESARGLKCSCSS